jgi:hypothetical protein
MGQKTEMKDDWEGCQTSSNTDADSGSYVTILKEPTSGSFREFCLAVIFHTEINDCGGSAALTTRHPSIHKSWQ